MAYDNNGGADGAMDFFYNNNQQRKQDLIAAARGLVVDQITAAQDGTEKKEYPPPVDPNTGVRIVAGSKIGQQVPDGRNPGQFLTVNKVRE